MIYSQDEQVTIHQGEALNILATLPENQIDVIIADPPYSSGGLFRSDRATGKMEKYFGSLGSDPGRYGTFGGDSRDGRSYFLWSTIWMTACWTIAKPTSQCFVFTDWRQLPTTSDALQVAGWTWRGILVWNKGKGSRRPQKGRFANPLEYIVWGSHGAMPPPKNIYPDTLINCPAVPPVKRQHPTEKPTVLIQELLSVCPEGGVVLDPFMGSGSTLEAAKYAGRRAIGIEIDKGFCEIAKRRLQNGSLL